MQLMMVLYLPLVPLQILLTILHQNCLWLVFLTGVAKETDLQTVKDEISSLTNEVNSNTSKIDALTQSSQSGIGSKTLDELVTELTANTAFMDAIKASLKGEEIQAVDGTTKGYLINA